LLNKKPVIGVASGYYPRENTWWHMVKEAYSKSVWKAGGIPVLLTHPHSNGFIEEIAANIDGLLLIGGPDLPIELYGGRPYDLKGEKPMHVNRVTFDRQIFEICLSYKKPVFGICAGLQHINIMYGGTLYEDLPTQLPNTVDHGYYKGPIVSHPVEIDRNSILYDILDVESITVNSTHHQGVKKLGTDLKPTAWTSEGLIEAIEIAQNDLFLCIAVQWHPELLGDNPKQMALFQWLIQEATVRK